jgi:3-oxoacyl-[acyl-carrier-protein] synthase-1
MRTHAAEILGLGMVTPVGLSAPAAAAAIRARIVRVRESSLIDLHSEPILAGFLDEKFLPELSLSKTAPKVPSARYARMLRLASSALQQACQGVSNPALLLALPEDGSNVGTEFLEQLAHQSGVELNVPSSKLFPQGRAGGLLALAEALRRLATTPQEHVLVGGVDTYCDLPLLDSLWEEKRLFVCGLTDGFVPGEGASFVLLGRPGRGRRLGLEPIASVLGVGTGIEKGHLYGAEPHLGDGLADAFRELFSSLSAPTPRIRWVYAGLNGESFWAKEWGVSYLRHSRYFEEGFRLEHPVDCMGDPGAALGPMLVSLAAIGIQREYRQAPCLVWCSSDREARGAALVDGVRHQRV